MTLVRQTPDDAMWEVVARAVFWSRDVDLSDWREHIRAGHMSYLPDSVARMSTGNFIRFLGRRDFLQCWPRIRTRLSPGASGLSRLDEAWSFLQTGTFNMPPQAALVAWRGRSKHVYDTIVHHQGASLYEVAAIAGVPYRRVHDHVQKLERQGLVRSVIDRTGPRPRRRLYTMRSALPRPPEDRRPAPQGEELSAAQAAGHPFFGV